MAIAFVGCMKLQASTLVILIACGLGCAGTEGAHPDDMTAEAHRAAAAKERGKADTHEAKYEPKAWKTRGVLDADQELEGLPDYIFNPTEVHLESAKLHSSHARDHERAAEALEEFEASECAPFESHTRRLCPLLGAVEQLENTERGVRVIVAEGVDARGLLAHMKCHFAFGRARGREGMPQCPLYLNALEMTLTGERTIDVSVEEPALRHQLRARMATHVAPRP